MSESDDRVEEHLSLVQNAIAQGVMPGRFKPAALAKKDPSLFGREGGLGQAFVVLAKAGKLVCEDDQLGLYRLSHTGDTPPSNEQLQSAKNRMKDVINQHIKRRSEDTTTRKVAEAERMRPENRILARGAETTPVSNPAPSPSDEGLALEHPVVAQTVGADVVEAQTSHEIKPHPRMPVVRGGVPLVVRLRRAWDTYPNTTTEIPSGEFWKIVGCNSPTSGIAVAETGERFGWLKINDRGWGKKTYSLLVNPYEYLLPGETRDQFTPPETVAEKGSPNQLEPPAEQTVIQMEDAPIPTPPTSREQELLEEVRTLKEELEAERRENRILLGNAVAALEYALQECRAKLNHGST